MKRKAIDHRHFYSLKSSIQRSLLESNLWTNCLFHWKIEFLNKTWKGRAFYDFSNNPWLCAKIMIFYFCKRTSFAKGNNELSRMKFICNWNFFGSFSCFVFYIPSESVSGSRAWLATRSGSAWKCMRIQNTCMGNFFVCFFGFIIFPQFLLVRDRLFAIEFICRIHFPFGLGSK